MSDDQVSIERFKVMERKLYRGIMTTPNKQTITIIIVETFA
jgi:uncharacterized membrane protein